jgi:arylsulfatase A-like enzyme
MNNFFSKMDRSILFIFVLFSTVVVASEGTVVGKNDRPNIIFILADDMGYSDLGCYGSEIKTPNLDRLGAGGVKLRSFYTNARCCPTRASLLTGMYPHEVGMGHMVSPPNQEISSGPYQGFLDERYHTVAEYLKAAGYATYMTGKWHVGEREQHWPKKRGFDRYFGLINGASGFYGVIPQEKGKRRIVLEEEDFKTPKQGFYMTDAFTDFAIGYLDEHQVSQPGTPFFLYLAYTAPHFPLHAPEEDVAKYLATYQKGWDIIRRERYDRMVRLGLIDQRFEFPDRPADIPAWKTAENKEEWIRKMAVYAAMIDRMDQNIGRLIERLKANGQFENTLIVFVSDNGACAENVEKRNFHDPAVEIGKPGSYVTYDTPWANVSSTPFKKYKRYLHEGGVASCGIISWPQTLKPYKGYHSSPVFVTDLVPTALELAGQDKGELAGVSMSFLWTGKAASERTYFWEHEGNRAVRKGDWKLVRDKEDSDWVLYNMRVDPAEKRDVSATNPAVVAALKELHGQWSDRVGVTYK